MRKLRSQALFEGEAEGGQNLWWVRQLNNFIHFINLCSASGFHPTILLCTWGNGLLLWQAPKSLSELFAKQCCFESGRLDKGHIQYFLHVFSSPVSLLIPQYRYMEHCVDRINEELLWKQVDVVLCIVTCAVIVTCRGILTWIIGMNLLTPCVCKCTVELVLHCITGLWRQIAYCSIASA